MSDRFGDALAFLDGYLAVGASHDDGSNRGAVWMLQLRMTDCPPPPPPAIVAVQPGGSIRVSSGATLTIGGEMGAD